MCLRAPPVREKAIHPQPEELHQRVSGRKVKNHCLLWEPGHKHGRSPTPAKQRRRLLIKRTAKSSMIEIKLLVIRKAYLLLHVSQAISSESPGQSRVTGFPIPLCPSLVYLSSKQECSLLGTDPRRHWPCVTRVSHAFSLVQPGFWRTELSILQRWVLWDTDGLHSSVKSGLQVQTSLSGPS